MKVRFTAWVEPEGKGRPRARVTNGGHAQIYTPTKTRQYEAKIAQIASEYLPPGRLEGPLRVDILAVIARPGRLCRKKDPDGLLWCPKRPDADNIRKAVLDALAPYWKDDAQVVAGETVKAYCEHDGRPRIEVAITDEIGTPALAWYWATQAWEY